MRLFDRRFMSGHAFLAIRSARSVISRDLTKPSTSFDNSAASDGVNVILGKALGVLPETEFLQPIRNRLHRGRHADLSWPDRATGPARQGVYPKNSLRLFAATRSALSKPSLKRP